MTAFPFNPSNGDTHIIGENNWEYDSTYGVWNKTSGGVTGNIGPTGATGAAGAAGPTGATGITGADVGLSYTVQAGTPSAGQVYRHHDKIKPSDTDGDGNDVGDYWGAAKIGDHIYYFEDDRTGYEISTITAKTDQTSYWEFTISPVDSSSVPTTTGLPVHMYYVAQGPTGATGAVGATGATGQAIETFGVVVDGAGSIITIGSKGFRYIPYACTIRNAVLIGNTTGTADFAVWRDTSLNLSGLTIGGISLNNRQSAQGITGFTADLAENDVLEFRIQGSPASITRASLFIEVEKT
jgi:hypothetical protein